MTSKTVVFSEEGVRQEIARLIEDLEERRQRYMEEEDYQIDQIYIEERLKYLQRRVGKGK